MLEVAQEREIANRVTTVRIDSARNMVVTARTMGSAHYTKGDHSDSPWWQFCQHLARCQEIVELHTNNSEIIL